MVIGTIFAGWWGWDTGPWMAILGGDRRRHARRAAACASPRPRSASTTSSPAFAINIIAPGVARFMASELFVDEQGGSIDGGSTSNSPGIRSRSTFTVPFLSGGDLFGWTHARPPRLASRRSSWFLLSDVAGLLKGLTTGLTLRRHADDRPVRASPATCCGTRRSACACGRPASARRPPTRSASTSIRFRYIGMAISGGAGRPGRRGARAVRQPLPGGPGGRPWLPRPGHDDLRQLASRRRGRGGAVFGYFEGITLRPIPSRWCWPSCWPRR